MVAVNRRIKNLSASDGFSKTTKANHAIAQQVGQRVGQRELRLARFLSSASLAAARVTLDVGRHSGTPMNRTTFVVLVTLCAFALGAFAVVCTKEPIVGGYIKTPVTDNDVIQAAEFAINAQSKTIQRVSDQQPSKPQLLKILRAEQQVVAGVNYRLTLSVMDDGNHQRTAEAIVWCQAWRPNPYELTSWTWK